MGGIDIDVLIQGERHRVGIKGEVDRGHALSGRDPCQAGQLIHQVINSHQHQRDCRERLDNLHCITKIKVRFKQGKNQCRKSFRVKYKRLTNISEIEN